jgi:DnaK suppressor protein
MQALTDAQREQLREEIARKRERTAARLAALERDLDDIVVASADAVRDDEHDPEGQTIAFERAQVAALLHDARAQLGELARAADRLEGPDAGCCERCGAAIAYERLLARPAARTCVRCAGSA